MGNKGTVEEQKESLILQQPKQGEASDFYWACRNGDITLVRQLAEEISYKNLNALEPNGSTGLHAATFYGHEDIVRYLLHEKCVRRHRKNRYDFTAYQECPNEKIRQLFHRPDDNQRFCSSEQGWDPLKLQNEPLINKIEEEKQNEEDKETMTDEWVMLTKDSNDEFSNKWISAMRCEDDMNLRTFCRYFITTAMTSTLSKVFLKTSIRLFAQSDPYEYFADMLQNFHDRCVPTDHHEYDETSNLLMEYRKTRNVENIIKLYTIECPFYRQLGYGNENFTLFFPLVWDLDKLSNRFFQGKSYRGMKINAECLRSYWWALEDPTRTIITESFCSTSKDESIARGFLDNESSEKSTLDYLDVLVIMEFNDQCSTAIQLDAFQSDLNDLSNYPNEFEVLLLPGTKFRVQSIEILDLIYVITLTNVSFKVDIEYNLRTIQNEQFFKQIQIWIDSKTD